MGSIKTFRLDRQVCQSFQNRQQRHQLIIYLRFGDEDLSRRSRPLLILLIQKCR